MATMNTYWLEETNYMRGKEEEEDEEKDDSCSEESATQNQLISVYTPRFFLRIDREVYYYVGQKIIIEEGLDSYGGMIWPAALSLCHYLDTHQKQLSLVDKTVLEIGAGTGLVSIVASLLGAWVTATDLPEILPNMRVNLSRNTRGLCRYTPQQAVLSWGYDLEHTYPTSVYRYDYVLAADVVYHHDFLDELLATMKHFCIPGTTLIWANKVRYETDLKFVENFKKSFHTTLLLEDGDMKIFMARSKKEKHYDDVWPGIQEVITEKEEEDEEKKEEEDEECCFEEKEDEKQTIDSTEECEEVFLFGSTLQNKENDKDEPYMSDTSEDEEEDMKQDGNDEEDEKDQSESGDSSSSPTNSDEEFTGQENIKQTSIQMDKPLAWVPVPISRLFKDIYHYAGEDIVIYESMDTYGAVMWPAALALCSFLDNNRHSVKLQGKEVLELGAGTGLVTIVASLLGASVTATDLPKELSNLRCNVMRNTKGQCSHMPKIEALSWGFDLEHTHPTSVYRYDYIVAADVVYYHDFLDELLATMKHFCQPGTTLIWANKIRFETDLTFIENFKNTFDTSLLAEDGDMKIFMATCRE